jgi:hypothetical protein
MSDVFAFCHATVLYDDSARDKVGHAIRRVIEEKKKARNSRDFPRGMKAEPSRRKDSGDDDGTSSSSNRGKRLLSLDDFIESEPDVAYTPPNSHGPTMKGIEPASNNVSASLIMPHSWDGVIVPSFLSLGMVAGATGSVNRSQSSNAHGTSQVTHSKFSMDQPLVPRPDISYLQSSQQLQSENEATLRNVPPHTTTLPRRIGWMKTSLQSMQQLDNSTIQQQGQGLPRTSGSGSAMAGPFDDSGNVKRIATLMDEQQNINNQMLLQRRLSLTGELGVASVNPSSNNSALAWAGLPSLSANSMDTGGYRLIGGTPSFSTLASGSTGSMVLPSTYTMDSSLTSVQGFASMDDLACVQSQQMQQLQMNRHLCSNNNTHQGTGELNITNNNSNNHKNQRQFF